MTERLLWVEAEPQPGSTYRRMWLGKASEVIIDLDPDAISAELDRLYAAAEANQAPGPDWKAKLRGEQRRPAEAMPHIAYTYRVRPLFGGAVCLGCEQVVDVGDDAIQWTDDAITHKFCPRPPIVEIEEQK